MSDVMMKALQIQVESLTRQVESLGPENERVRKLLTEFDHRHDADQARIRELEAEVAALREARGVRVKALEWEAFGTMSFVAQAPLFGRLRVEQFGRGKTWTVCFSVPGYCDTFLAGEWADAETAKAAAQADYERRILAAIEPAPVTVGEAVRDDAKTALAHLEAVEDAYTRWMLAHAVGDADLIHRDSNALSNALFTMFNSDPNDGPSEVTRALRALADAGEAG